MKRSKKITSLAASAMLLLVLPSLCFAQAITKNDQMTEIVEGLINGSVAAPATKPGEKALSDYSHAEKLVGAATFLTMFGNTAGAIEKFKEANRLYPNYGPGHYNLACTYMRTKQTDLAFISLKRALETDRTKYARLASSDSDFASVRDSSEFKNLLSQ